jgi:hypothetical protein
MARVFVAASGRTRIAADSVHLNWHPRSWRDNPTYRQLIALSRFFNVSPAFFFEEAETQRGAVPADAALALRDEAIREIALRAVGLSERSLRTIAGSWAGSSRQCGMLNGDNALVSGACTRITRYRPVTRPPCESGHPGRRNRPG